MNTPQISLEQWRALLAVVDHGGYAQAAEALNKSQSAITYAVQKIDDQLGVAVFEINGRKAVLTPTGQTLYRRAKLLVEEASSLEKSARTLSAGWEAEIGLAVEILFPSWLLFDCLSAFGAESPDTRIEVIESVIGGTSEALLQGKADIAITPRPPPGFLGELMGTMKMLPVAHPDHPLHHLGRPISKRDLAHHRHLVVRDSGTARDRKALSIEVQRRWTVSHMTTSIEAIRSGHGFAWLPTERIRGELTRGELKPLPLREGGEYQVPLYLVIADPDFAGPGVRRLAEIIKTATPKSCPETQSAVIPEPSRPE